MKLLNFEDLRRKLGGRSRSSVYRDLGEGRLPKPVRLGSRLYWREDVVDAWMRDLEEDVDAWLHK